jgi:hypothetical protein
MPDTPIDTTTRDNTKQAEKVAGYDLKTCPIRNAAAEELKQLSKGLISYRELLSKKQQEEFDSKF